MKRVLSVPDTCSSWTGDMDRRSRDEGGDSEPCRSAGDEVHVTVRYTAYLHPVDGTYEYVYPTVVGPRYVSDRGADDQLQEGWVSNP